MLRVLLVVAVAVVIGGAAFFVARSGDETAQGPGTTSPPEQPLRTDATVDRASTTGTETAEAPACPVEDFPEVSDRVRIGAFAAPESVPEYEVVEEQPAGGDGTCAVRLLADTRSRSRADYVLITRDLKVRYADYDAASVEFIDLSATLDYLGGALIFNTPEGADFLGYTRFLPNPEGYVVSAAE